MTEPTERPAAIHSTTNFHLYGAVKASAKFIPRETDAPAPDYGGSYGYVSLSGEAGGSADLTIFVISRAQAESIAAAFWAISTQFPPSPCPAADVAHDCATPAAGELDTTDYPVPMAVIQRDPADAESWVYRCGAEHASSFDLPPSRGWQSCDYASEDDALSAAAEHARAMHDGGLPNELAERVAAAERRAAERAGSLIGRNVRRTDDDGAVPMVGTIHAITADPEVVMVAWPRADSAEPAVTIPEPMDELTAAGGHWLIPKAAAPDADHSSDGGFRYPVRHR